ISSEPKAPRKEKPLKIMDGWVYKEVAQKGGMKWYLGETEKAVLARLEEKKALKEQAELDSPVPSSPTEQMANIPEQTPQPVQAEDVADMPVETPKEAEPVVANLVEGGNISL
ncbi:MAG: hypothetical protein K0S20_278, partial [Patescibacteria group bacterium]|nr:hypothetical protein [Patescibacteria group bacterium]